MFGLVTPCKHSMAPEQAATYWAHLCGTCLALRDSAGQTARAALTQDAVVLSMLVEELAGPGDSPATVPAGRCLRGPSGVRRVTDPTGRAARYAAAVSAEVLHIGLADHRADGDGSALVTRCAIPVVERWRRRALLAAQEETGTFEAIDACALVARGARPEGVTEEAFSHAFAAVARLARRPECETDLRALGHAFGRIALLVDAVEDYDTDLGRGTENVLCTAWPSASLGERLLFTRAVLEQQHGRIEACLDRLEVHSDSAVAYVLRVSLRHRTARAVRTMERRHGLVAPDGPEPRECTCSRGDRRAPGAPAGGGTHETRDARDPRDARDARDGSVAAPAQEPAARVRRGRLGLLGVVSAAAFCDGDCCDCGCCDCGCCECCHCGGHTHRRKRRRILRRLRDL